MTKKRTKTHVIGGKHGATCGELLARRLHVLGVGRRALLRDRLIRPSPAQPPPE